MLHVLERSARVSRIAKQVLEATEGGIDLVPEREVVVGVVSDVVLDGVPEVLDGVEVR